MAAADAGPVVAAVHAIEAARRHVAAHGLGDVPARVPAFLRGGQLSGVVRGFDSGTECGVHSQFVAWSRPTRLCCVEVDLLGDAVHLCQVPSSGLMRFLWTDHTRAAWNDSTGPPASETIMTQRQVPSALETSWDEIRSPARVACLEPSPSYMTSAVQRMVANCFSPSFLRGVHYSYTIGDSHGRRQRAAADLPRLPAAGNW